MDFQVKLWVLLLLGAKAWVLGSWGQHWETLQTLVDPLWLEKEGSDLQCWVQLWLD